MHIIQVICWHSDGTLRHSATPKTGTVGHADTNGLSVTLLPDTKPHHGTQPQGLSVTLLPATKPHHGTQPQGLSVTLLPATKPHQATQPQRGDGTAKSTIAHQGHAGDGPYGSSQSSWFDTHTILPKHVVELGHVLARFKAGLKIGATQRVCQTKAPAPHTGNASLKRYGIYSAPAPHTVDASKDTGFILPRRLIQRANASKDTGFIQWMPQKLAAE